MNSLLNSNYTFVGSLGSCVVAVQEPGLPQLKLRRAEDEVTISWPDEHAYYALEVVDDLASPARWRTLADGARPEIKVRLGIGTRYFRLAKRPVTKAG